MKNHILMKLQCPMSSARGAWYSCQEGKVLFGKPYVAQTLRVLDYSVGVAKTAEKDRRIRLDTCSYHFKKS